MRRKLVKTFSSEVVLEESRNVATIKCLHLCRPVVLFWFVVIKARARRVCLAEFVDSLREFLTTSYETCLICDEGWNGRSHRPNILHGSSSSCLCLRVAIGLNLFCQALNHVLNALLDLI